MHQHGVIVVPDAVALIVSSLSCTCRVTFGALQVQMSLDTKRAEIRKLEEQAQQREDALKRSESMLEEDAMRFDAFLKENDYKGALYKSTTDFFLL